MTTVVDAMVLELGLDPAKFTAGQREAIDALRKMQQESVAGAKEIEARTKRTNDLLVNFRREALSVMGLFYGGMGLKQFAEYVTNLDASTGRYSRTLGISAQELQAWQAAVQASGGSAETASAAIGGLDAAIIRFKQTGQGGDQLAVLNQFGISIRDAAGNWKTATQVYKELAAAVEDKKMNPRDAAGLMSHIPGMNQDMINRLLLGSKELNAALATGMATKPPNTAGAEGLQKSWAELSTAATRAGQAVMDHLYKPLSLVADKLKELISLSPLASGVLGGLATLAGGAGGLYGAYRGAKAFLSRGGVKEGADKVAQKGSGLLGRAIQWVGRKPLGVAGALLDADPTQALETDQPYDPVTNPGGRIPAADGRAPTAPVPPTIGGYALRMKDNAGTASPAVQMLARALQNDVSGLNRFTSFNDSFHRGTGSRHAQGLALDFTIGDPKQSAAVAEQVRQKLSAMGIKGTVLDEYSNPSRNATAGHIHVQFDNAGVADEFVGRAGRNVGARSAAGDAGRGDTTSTSTTVTINGIYVDASGAKDANEVAAHIGAATKREMTAAPANGP